MVSIVQWEIKAIKCFESDIECNTFETKQRHIIVILWSWHFHVRVHYGNAILFAKIAYIFFYLLIHFVALSWRAISACVKNQLFVEWKRCFVGHVYNLMLMLICAHRIKATVYFYTHFTFVCFSHYLIV